MKIITLESKIIEGCSPCKYDRFIATETETFFKLQPFFYQENRGVEKPNWKMINQFEPKIVSKTELEKLIAKVPAKFRD